jgi:sugar transferase (PEP-CTERM system associated)
MKRTLFILLLGDLLGAFLAELGAYWISFGASADLKLLLSERLAATLTIPLVLLFCSYFSELYERERNLSRIDLGLRIAVVQALAFFSLSIIYYLVPALLIGRGMLLYSLGIFAVLQYLSHRTFQYSRYYPLLAKRILVLGVGPLAETIERLIAATYNNYVFAGFINPGKDLLMAAGGGRVVGTMDRLAEAVKRERAQKLVVSLTERRGVMPVGDILACKLGGVEVIDAVSFYEQMTGKLLIENIQPSWFIFSSGFRVTAFMRVQKRIFDIFFSGLGLILAAPLFPLIALLVKLDSAGPIFFSQSRVGEKERLFKVHKFRTMGQDAEKETGAVWAQKDDPRVTRVGRCLRKSRLDEIPQLFNVLKGDMSFVGPRPERPEFVEQLKEKIPYYSKRHFVKPGVTGWAQVKCPYGASAEESLEKLRYDLYYIKNYSLLLDFEILLETIKVVLFGRGSR